MAISVRNKTDNPLRDALDDADVNKLHDWCHGLLEDGKNMRKAHEAQWWENLATFGGDLWVEFDSTMNRLYELDRPSHRVRIPINLVQPAVRTEYAKLLKNRPIIRCVAQSNEKKHMHAAKVGDSMLNDYAEQKFSMPKVRRRALQWALLCGAGGVFTDYDSTMLGKVEVPMDPQGTPVFTREEIDQLQSVYKDRHQRMKTTLIKQGELVIKAMSPFQWVFDFSKLYVEEAWWLIVSEIMDVDEIWRRWNVEVESEKMKTSVWENRLFAMRGIREKDEPMKSNYQRLAEVHRMYVKPGHRFFPEGAHIVFTRDRIVHVETFPFEHGELPLSVMGHIFNPVSQHPMSIVEQVKPVVLEISKTESQMIENRNLMANPPWLEYRQNRIQGEIQNKPGLRLIIDYVHNVPEPHPIEMPDLPSYVQNLPTLLGEHVLEITGQNETAQGQVPPGARSGVAIAYLTEENDTKLGPTVMEWEEMNERVGGQIIGNFAQFYDTPRTIQIFKPHSEPEVLDFIGTVLNGVAGVKREAGSAMPRSTAAKQQFTMDLFDRGLIRNPRTIKDMLDVGQGEVEEWEKDMDQQERENRKLGEGERPEVYEWHNHPAHLYVLHDYMKSAEWDDLDEAQQAPYVEHEADHQDFMRMQAQQQQPAEPPGGGGNTGTGNGVNTPPPQGQYSSPDDVGAVADAGAVQSSIA